MLQRLVEMRWPISAVLSDDSVTKRSDRHFDLSSAHWSLAEELVKVLEPFDMATNVLCSEVTCTVSCTVPIVFGLLHQIVNLQGADSSLPPIMECKCILQEEIKGRWKLDDLDVSTCLVLSTVLDLRFKPVKFLTEENIETIKTLLIEKMKKLPTAVTQDVRPAGCPPLEKKRKTALEMLLGDDGTDETSTGNMHSTEADEVEQYFQEKPVSRSSDIFLWWQNNCGRYPRLSAIAMGLLMTPATSAASERTFSTAGLTVSKLRSSLKPSHVDALIFLNKNKMLL